MEKYGLFLVTVILASSATAVYHSNDTVVNGSDKQDKITDPTLDQPDITFSQANGTCGAPKNQSVRFNQVSEDGETTIKVDGTVNTPNPCYKLEYNLRKTDNIYELNVSSKSYKRICVQCTGSIDYTAEIKIPENSTLAVIHDGEQEGKFQTKSEELKNTEEKSRGLLHAILSFFGFS